MAPTSADPRPDVPVTRQRTRSRREPTPLDQLPAWRELVPVMGDIARTGPLDGVEALLSGLDPDQRRAVTHGDGPMLVVAG